MTKTLMILMALILMACGKPKDGGPGPKGNTGTPGVAGAQGPKGDQGIPGTSVSIVSLCPGYGPTHYPDNFPEQAFCIGGSLYGVYYTGAYAFLAELPPGNYNSTSPQGCNLTISANCVVTQN